MVGILINTGGVKEASRKLKQEGTAGNDILAMGRVTSRGGLPHDFAASGDAVYIRQAVTGGA